MKNDEIPPGQMQASAEVSETPSRPSALSSISDGVKIELECRAGSVIMTLAELMKLDKGAVVTLDLPLNGRVDVCLNGDIVAQGDLVAVGDHYGVRIVEIMASEQSV